MVIQVGRNDPCPCQSGLKFKKCCGATIKAPLPWASGGYFEIELDVIKEPTARVVVSKNGGKTFETVPGIRPFIEISYSDDRYKNKEIEELFSLIFPLIPQHHKSKNEVQAPLQEVKHKLYAVNYHLTELVKEEIDTEKQMKEEKVIPDGPYYHQTNDKMIFELEALLFQTKACLDRIARILNPIFSINLNGFNSKNHKIGGDVLAVLNNNCPKDLKDIAKKICSILEVNIKSWIEEAVDYRDAITHYRQLDGMFCFVTEPITGENNRIKVFYPIMPNRQRMTIYAANILKSLIGFAHEFLITLFT